jgi:hypothetical protein
LQKVVAKHDSKSKKILEKISELKIEDNRSKELKDFDTNILKRRK